MEKEAKTKNIKEINQKRGEGITEYDGNQFQRHKMKIQKIDNPKDMTLFKPPNPPILFKIKINDLKVKKQQESTFWRLIFINQTSLRIYQISCQKQPGNEENNSKIIFEVEFSTTTEFSKFFSVINFWHFSRFTASLFISYYDKPEILLYSFQPLRSKTFDSKAFLSIFSSPKVIDRFAFNQMSRTSLENRIRPDSGPRGNPRPRFVNGSQTKLIFPNFGSSKLTKFLVYYYHGTSSHEICQFWLKNQKIRKMFDLDCIVKSLVTQLCMDYLLGYNDEVQPNHRLGSLPQILEKVNFKTSFSRSKRLCFMVMNLHMAVIVIAYDLRTRKKLKVKVLSLLQLQGLVSKTSQEAPITETGKEIHADFTQRTRINFVQKSDQFIRSSVFDEHNYHLILGLQTSTEMQHAQDAELQSSPTHGYRVVINNFLFSENQYSVKMIESCYSPKLGKIDSEWTEIFEDLEKTPHLWLQVDEVDPYSCGLAQATQTPNLGILSGKSLIEFRTRRKIKVEEEKIGAVLNKLIPISTSMMVGENEPSCLGPTWVGIGSEKIFLLKVEKHHETNQYYLDLVDQIRHGFALGEDFKIAKNFLVSRCRSRVYIFNFKVKCQKKQKKRNLLIDSDGEDEEDVNNEKEEVSSTLQLIKKIDLKTSRERLEERSVIETLVAAEAKNLSGEASIEVVVRYVRRGENQNLPERKDLILRVELRKESTLLNQNQSESHHDHQIIAETEWFSSQCRISEFPLKIEESWVLPRAQGPENRLKLLFFESNPSNQPSPEERISQTLDVDYQCRPSDQRRMINHDDKILFFGQEHPKGRAKSPYLIFVISKTENKLESQENSEEKSTKENKKEWKIEKIIKTDSNWFRYVVENSRLFTRLSRKSTTQPLTVTQYSGSSFNQEKIDESFVIKNLDLLFLLKFYRISQSRFYILAAQSLTFCWVYVIDPKSKTLRLRKFLTTKFKRKKQGWLEPAQEDEEDSIQKEGLVILESETNFSFVY